MPMIELSVPDLGDGNGINIKNDAVFRIRDRKDFPNSFFDEVGISGSGFQEIDILCRSI